MNISNDWEVSLDKLNQELAQLPGFNVFNIKKIMQTIQNPAFFSVGFDKEKGKGGSVGIGRLTFAYSSNIQTFFSYSVPSDKKNGKKCQEIKRT